MFDASSHIHVQPTGKAGAQSVLAQQLIRPSLSGTSGWLCSCRHHTPHAGWAVLRGGRRRDICRRRQRFPGRHPSQTHAVSSTSLLFTASTIYTTSLFVLMLLTPRRRLTVGLMQSDWIFVPLSAAYLALLVQSWTPETLQLIMPGSLQAGLTGTFKPQFFPKLVGIQQLFAQVITAASLWVHLLSVNLFAARTAYLQGLQHQIPAWHSILLSMAFGPIGLLSNILTHATVKPARLQPASAQT